MIILERLMMCATKVPRLQTLIPSERRKLKGFFAELGMTCYMHDLSTANRTNV